MDVKLVLSPQGKSTLWGDEGTGRRENLNLTERLQQEAGEIYTVGSFIICTLSK
jgi:hypothetical protein